LTLRSKETTIIADAKFYKDTLVRRRNEEGSPQRLHAGNLYQLSAYLAHAAKREGGRRVAGLLIYPRVSRSIAYRYELLGFPVVVATVNLAAEWPDIESEILRLIPMVEREMTTLAIGHDG